MDVKCALKVIAISLVITSNAFAVIPTAKKTEKQKLLEELKGVPASVATQPPMTKANPKSMSLSQKHLNAGFLAFTNKDYIKALKHYNTILAKHPHSKEVKSAYLAKAKLYQEMGLLEQAKLNARLALKFDTKAMTLKK